MGWEKLLAMAAGKIDGELLLKVEYLLAENRILRELIGAKPRLSDKQRVTLAKVGKKLGRKALAEVATVVTPETILRWHRQLVARKFDTSDKREKPPGRPPIDAVAEAQVLRLARENPSWGYRRIAAELKGLTYALSHQSVRNVLRRHGIDPSPRRKNNGDWSTFVKSHTDTLLATDFFTTEVWSAFGLVTHYVLFFIHVASRKVYLADVTPNPTGQWVRNAARNLTAFGGVVESCRYLIHDRDAKYTAGFDLIFRSVGIEPLLLPPSSPNLNAFAERFVRSIKQECLDRMIFFSEAQLRHAIGQYLDHYHHERPHQGKGNTILFPLEPEQARPRDGPVRCRKRLGGLLKHYHRNAA